MTDFTEHLQTAIADRYVIERHLGEGGMATVYLAHDVKHDRKVALKVLRPELAAVIGAERFLAEIKTTANLQHPNILPLFDSGDADGQLFYVMPYMEGETLRERIEHEKQLPVEDAVRIGVEVAGALDYAHRQGVIHRDIKPENILLHDGRALVADFGIALALSTAGRERMTETGMSVGTPHYMSPEQAMGGHEVTVRSDVYALGATLYEALVGEPPFTGPTAQAIIARLVTEDPRPLRTQRKTIPEHVETAVLKALERLPADRFRAAAELAEALEGRLNLPARGAGDLTGSGARDGVRRALVRLSLRGTLAAAGLAAILVAVALWGWLRPRPQPPLSRETVVLGPTYFPGIVAGGAGIAPDGSAIVYADTTGKPKLWIKERGELDAHVLVNLNSHVAPAPSFSPDGRWIVYSDGGLEKVARAGGAPVTLSDSSTAWGAAWLEDGTIAFIGGTGTEVLRTTQDGGPATRVFSTDSGAVIQRITPVPGSDAVLLGIAPPNARDLALNLETGATHVVATGGTGAWVVPGGDIVYAQANGTLLAAPFDIRKLSVSGPAVSVLDGVRATSGVFDATLGADGTLLYVRGGASAEASRFQLVDVSRDGSVTPLDTAWSAVLPNDGGVGLSPDGTRLALNAMDTVNDRSDIYILPLPHGPATRLTFDGTVNVRPAWSPDGRTILYASNQGGKMELWTRKADGSGRPVRAVSENRPVYEGLWSPDGKWIVYRTDNAAPGHGDILAVHTHGDRTPVPLVATGAQETSPALSPDGRWLAYASDTSGRFEVYVRPFPDAQGGLWQVSTDGGTSPIWSHDGKELFYRDALGWMVAAEVRGAPTFSVGARKRLFLARDYDGTQYNHYYAVTPDGGDFLMLRSEFFASANLASDPMVLVRNWLPELRAKLGQ